MQKSLSSQFSLQSESRVEVAVVQTENERYALGLLNLLVDKWWKLDTVPGQGETTPIHLHKCVVRSAIAGFDLEDVSSRQEGLIADVFADVPLSSNESLAGKYGKHKVTIANEIVRAASCAVESGGTLWSSMLHMLNWQVKNGTYLPLLVVRNMRFDETPTKLRATMAQNENEQHLEEVDESPFVKVMQSEFLVHCLLKKCSDNSIVHIVGKVPVQLQAIDRTTTECTKRCLLNMEQVVPNFRSLCSMFPWKLLLSTSDRYSANQAAERSIQADDVTWSRCTLPCDVHKISQAHTKTSDLMPEDISGVLSTSLSQRELGSAHTLRQILRKIFKERLMIVYGAPPSGDVAAYRQDLFDLTLPVSSGRSSKKVKTLLNQRRRFILAATLNGDLQSPDIIHYCTYGCCSSMEITRARFDKWTAWALCPHKCPHFARNRWTGQEWSLSWNALLMGHHGLHEAVLEVYTGVPIVAPSSESSAHHLQILDAIPNEICDWGAVIDAETDPSLANSIVPVGEAMQNLRAATAKVEQEMQQEQALQGEAAKEDANQNPGMSVEARKAFKKKSGHWSHSKPLARLLMLLDVMRPLKSLIHHFFYLGSKQFERDQQRLCARGKQRTYPIVDAAGGKHLARFFESLGKLFQQQPTAMPVGSRTMWNRSLSYRLIARCGCAMHMLLQKSHKGYPYRLFEILAAENPDVRYRLARDPPCLLDELANVFFAKFPPDSEDFEQNDALSCLESLAQAIQLDIAGIEARHALTRRITSFKSLQTWISALEDVSAHWTTRQIRTEKSFVQEVKVKSQEEQTQQKDKANKNKTAKRGAGGGAWRAYVHIHHAGVKLTRQSAKAIAKEYRDLTSEQYAFYKDLGSKGTMAYKMGFQAFGPSLATPASANPTAQPLPVGAFSETGAIVAADQLRPVELVAHAGFDFERGLRSIASKHMKIQAQFKKEDIEADNLLAKHSADVLGSASPANRSNDSSAIGFCQLAYTGGLQSSDSSAGRPVSHTPRNCLHYVAPADEVTKVPRYC